MPPLSDEGWLSLQFVRLRIVTESNLRVALLVEVPGRGHVLYHFATQRTQHLTAQRLLRWLQGAALMRAGIHGSRYASNTSPHRLSPAAAKLCKLGPLAGAAAQARPSQVQ